VTINLKRMNDICHPMTYIPDEYCLFYYKILSW